jgi:hypothetical protein
MRDYQGNEIIVPDDKAKKIADAAGLLEIEVAGQVHYISPKDIASIKPQQGAQDKIDIEHRIDPTDHRGEVSPAKELLRKKWGNISG